MDKLGVVLEQAHGKADLAVRGVPPTSPDMEVVMAGHPRAFQEQATQIVPGALLNVCRHNPPNGRRASCAWFPAVRLLTSIPGKVLWKIAIEDMPTVLIFLVIGEPPL